MTDNSGLNRNQSSWTVIIFFSILLIIFSSVTLFFRYLQKDLSNYQDIKSANKKLIVLRNISDDGLNTQRFSSNLMNLRNDSGEIKFNETQIETCRRKLKKDLDEYSHLDLSASDMKDSMNDFGNQFLIRNGEYLKLTNSNDTASAYQFRINVTRPILEKLLSLNKKVSDNVSNSINDITLSNESIFTHFEFWLLLLGISPFVILFFIVMKNFLMILFWEIF